MLPDFQPSSAQAAPTSDRLAAAGHIMGGGSAAGWHLHSQHLLSQHLRSQHLLSRHLLHYLLHCCSILSLL